MHKGLFVSGHFRHQLTNRFFSPFDTHDLLRSSILFPARWRTADRWTDGKKEERPSRKKNNIGEDRRVRSMSDKHDRGSLTSKLLNVPQRPKKMRATATAAAFVSGCLTDLGSCAAREPLSFPLAILWARAISINGEPCEIPRVTELLLLHYVTTDRSFY